jgi:hypothetical protein
VSELRRLLERWKAKGTKIDLLIVDYADLMAPERITENSVENSKSVYVNLRGLAMQEDLAVLTATQTNRQGLHGGRRPGRARQRRLQQDPDRRRGDFDQQDRGRAHGKAVPALLRGLSQQRVGLHASGRAGTRSHEVHQQGARL